MAQNRIFTVITLGFTIRIDYIYNAFIQYLIINIYI